MCHLLTRGQPTIEQCHQNDKNCIGFLIINIVDCTIQINYEYFLMLNKFYLQIIILFYSSIRYLYPIQLCNSYPHFIYYIPSDVLLFWATLTDSILYSITYIMIYTHLYCIKFLYSLQVIKFVKSDNFFYLFFFFAKIGK